MANDFKCQKELAAENPGGMDKLPQPHNFSSNPGFMSTAGMLGASAPANGNGVMPSTSARGALPAGRAVGPSRAVAPFSGR